MIEGRIDFALVVVGGGEELDRTVRRWDGLGGIRGMYFAIDEQLCLDLFLSRDLWCWHILSHFNQAMITSDIFL